MINDASMSLALCALLTGNIEGSNFRNVCLMFAYVCLVLCLQSDLTKGLYYI